MRRFFGGRHPLCGIGVTSVMDRTCKPDACSCRRTASRPGPGPLTNTSTSRMPMSIAERLTALAALCAAKGVLLREPRILLAGTAPGQHATLRIGHGDERIVKARLHIDTPTRHIPTLAPNCTPLGLFFAPFSVYPLSPAATFSLRRASGRPRSAWTRVDCARLSWFAARVRADSDGASGPDSCRCRPVA